ncbi:hypothetical protein M513_05365 [Trichuris suis]|uniref:Uncharacterized protein n=1 Tax=Trichuris suis TaxID=68888 RepID=A0A085M9G3_9BILA|nr:hypothetical protein M513_05365 [Trichuris suis]
MIVGAGFVQRNRHAHAGMRASCPVLSFPMRKLKCGPCVLSGGFVFKIAAV